MKNTYNKFPIGTKIKKKFDDGKTNSGAVTTTPRERRNEDGIDVPSWQVKYDDGDSEELDESELDDIAIGPQPKFDPIVHRDEEYLGLNGETSWILVTDHFS